MTSRLPGLGGPLPLERKPRPLPIMQVSCSRPHLDDDPLPDVSSRLYLALLSTFISVPHLYAISACLYNGSDEYDGAVDYLPDPFPVGNWCITDNQLFSLRSGKWVAVCPAPYPGRPFYTVISRRARDT